MDLETSAGSLKKRKRRHLAVVPPGEKNVRGQTVAHDMNKKWNGIKIVVEFDENSVPIGEVVRKKVATWAGALVRGVVPLAEYPNWFKVPEPMKEDLWVGMELRFIIDVKYKKKAISHCGVLWRRFKTHLTKEFVRPYLDDPELLENPPYLWDVYPNIKKPDWLKFVMSRCSEEFQELSKLQAERRDMNEYDHRIGKDGYAGLSDKMKAAGVSIDPKDRHVMWLLARQDKKGEYSNDATKEIAEKIEVLKHDEKEGKVVTKGNEDILTLALGTPEHSGRVRAGGMYCTPTTYFNLPKRRSNKEYTKKLEAQLREKDDHIVTLKQSLIELLKQQGLVNSPIDETLSELLKKHVGMLNSTPVENVASNSGKSDNRQGLLAQAQNRNSCSQQSKEVSKTKHTVALSKPKVKKIQSKAIKEKGIVATSNGMMFQKCKLALGSKDNVVAEGSIYPMTEASTSMHCLTLPDAYVRVSIDKALSGGALLPLYSGSGEHSCVKDAVGSFVAWPKEFVILENVVEKHAPLINGGKENRFTKFYQTVEKKLGDNGLITVPLVGALFVDEMDDITVSMDELSDVCHMGHLASSCLITYIRYLYTTYGIARAKYAFGNPQSINVLTKDDGKTRYIQELASIHGDRVLLIPYNSGGHWVLIGIDIPSMEVYWFNSLGSEPNPDLKLEINTAIKTVNLSQGKRKNNPNPNWNYVKCPQQKGVILCGYYVMLFMLHFIEDPGLPIKTKVMELARKDTYTNREIDVLRHDFIGFIDQFIK